MSGAEHPFPWSEDAICRPPAEKDARCNVCGQSLDTFPCPVSWDSEHRPRHDETRPIPPAETEAQR